MAQIDGEPLMPWQVDDALRTLADLWSLSTAEASQTIRDNLRTLAEQIRPVGRSAIPA